MRIQPGSMIGPYRILAEIGRGGMAVVYEAEQVNLGRRVALKILPEHVHAEPEAVARFEVEAEAAARLDHPNIVHIIDRGSVDGHFFIAMDLVKGPTLDRAIEERRQKMKEGELRFDRQHVEWAVRIMIDVLRALAYAHERGVVHRDMKPQNILMGDDGRPRVSDFGLARVDRGPGITMPGQVIGTPSYMSPEMAQPGVYRVDHRTDVYSCGVTLYELLALELPFAGADSHAVIHSIVHKSPPPLRGTNPHLPRDMETIVLKAMEKAPDDRYATAAGFADDLERFINFAEIQARPAGPARRVIRFARRHKGATAAAVLAIVIAVIFAIRLSRMIRIGGLVESGAKCLESWDFEQARHFAKEALSIDSNDASAAELLANATGHPRRTVRVIGGPALIYVVSYDHLTGQLGQRKDLFRVESADGIRSVEVPRGDYRLIAQSPTDENRFGDRWLSAGIEPDDRVLTIRVLSNADIETVMISVAAGSYPIGDDASPGSRPKRTLDFVEFRIASRPVEWREILPTLSPDAARRLAGRDPSSIAQAITWYEGDDFLATLGLRYPTEYEWEAACRGISGTGEKAPLQKAHQSGYGVWTFSRSLHYPGADKLDSNSTISDNPQMRISRGTPPRLFEKDPEASPSFSSRIASLPGTSVAGVRGVRSVRPPR